MKKTLIFLSIILFIFSFIIAFTFFEVEGFVYVGVISIVGLITTLLLLQIELQKEEKDKRGRYTK